MKNKITLILEGPDGSGKSTLASALSKQFNLNIIKMTAYGSQDKDEYIQKLQCDNVVLDRSWISESIYADIFGRNLRISEKDCNHLNKYCTLNNIPVIILLPSIDVIKTRLNVRGDEFGTTIIDNIELIYDRYYNWALAHSELCTIISDLDIQNNLDRMEKLYEKY